MKELIQTALKNLYVKDFYTASNIAQEYLQHSDMPDTTSRNCEMLAVVYMVGFIQGKRTERRKRKR